MSPLKYDTILASDRGITETHKGKVVLFVPAADMEGITLKFGRTGHNPIVSIFMGIVLGVIGIFGLVLTILNPARLRYALGMIALGVIGGSILFDSVKKRYFLEIYKRKDFCRLVFSKQAQLKDIRDFCDKVRETFKYPIKENL